MTEMKKTCACDYEACREVWKRVAPGEDPYPMADNANTQMSAQDSELTLPGAEANPCCMGSEASVSVEVLQGFLREELGDAQVYAYLSSCTPRRELARAFRALSEDEKRHARDLAAADLLNHRQGILPARVRGAARIRATSARCCAASTMRRPARATITPARERRRWTCASASCLRR